MQSLHTYFKRILPKFKGIGKHFKNAVHTALILFGVTSIILIVDMRSFSVDEVSLDVFIATLFSLYLALLIVYTGLLIVNRVVFTPPHAEDVPVDVIIKENFPGALAEMSSASVSDASMADLKRKSIHESGHVVAALLLGLCPDEVVIHENGGYCKLPLPNKCNISADIWEKHVIIDYCGAVAEFMFYGSYCSGCLLGKDSDWALAEEHIRTYLLLTAPSLPKLTRSSELDFRIAEISNLFFKKSENLLSGKEDLIRDFADLLYRKKSVKKKDIQDWAASHSIVLPAE